MKRGGVGERVFAEGLNFANGLRVSEDAEGDLGDGLARTRCTPLYGGSAIFINNVLLSFDILTIHF